MTEKTRPAGDSKLFGLSVLSSGSALSALISYLRFAQITAIFGANWRTDAFAIAMVFPLLLRDVVAHSFGAAFIPIYSRVMENRGHDGAVAFVNRTISWLILLCSVFIAALWFFSGILVRIVCPNGSPELLALASNLLRIVLPMIMLATTNGILSNFIKYEKRFAVLSLGGLIGLTVSLLCLILVKDAIGIKILSISILVGELSQFIFLLIQSYRSGFCVRPSLSGDPYISQMARMAMPVIGGTVIGFFGPIADKMLASFLPESSVTAIDYANRIKRIALVVLFQPFLTFADLKFSALAAKDKADELLASLRKNINTTSLVMFPAAVILTVLAIPVVSVFFQRGNLTGEDSKYIAYALSFYAPWFAQFGIGALVSRTFYSQKDSVTPVTIGIFAIISNVLLNLILVGPLGIGGLALATTLISTAKTIYLTWSLSRKLGGLDLRLIIGEQLKILAANILLLAVLLILMRFLPFSTEDSFFSRIGNLFVYTAGGAAFLFTALHVSGCRTFSGALAQITKRFRKDDE